MSVIVRGVDSTELVLGFLAQSVGGHCGVQTAYARQCKGDYDGKKGTHIRIQMHIRGVLELSADNITNINEHS